MAKEKLTNKQMESIFDTMEEIDSNRISLQEGVDKLKDEIGIFSETSYKFFYNAFKNMKKGALYKKRPNIEMTKFLIENFFKKDGKDGLIKALKSVRENIIYYYNYTKDKSKGLLKICREISKDNKINISFEDSDLFIDTKYTKDNFLQEVYITENEYDKLEKLITEKKNIILQGSAGVGKTYAAKRLAYSIIGEEDKARVKMIQFHQSYSYEDFIMGYRPNENGFELKEGVFYNFCKEAEEDEGNKYFLIIDEINRGNISKIFGELFMLIENDKRGEGEALELIYKEDEKFFVPENLYIIGLMNTADRSLAMLDYALRRRFAFYDMKPAFDSEKFKEYQEKLKDKKFNSLIEKVKELNKEILADGSLGEGFCIGHSYFCNLETIGVDKLSLIIEFELIPLLKEYWFDDKEKVNKWENELRDSIK